MFKIFAILLISAFVAPISCIDDPDDTHLFANTCTDTERETMEGMLIQNLAERLSDQAYTILGMMEEFKDEYAQSLHNQRDFQTLLTLLKGKEWLRAFNWYQDEILPKEKQLGTQMPPQYLEIFHDKSQELLPKLHKALKMILGSLVEMKAHGFDTYDSGIVQYLRLYMDDSIDAVKSVLCTFTTFMQSSDVGLILDLTQSEVPKITKENNGLLYRDTLNFLEYLNQVFKFIEQDVEKLICEVKTSIGIPCDHTPDWYGPDYNVDGDTNKYNVTIRPWDGKD